MSSNYHTPIVPGAAGDASTVNAPLGELDSTISSVLAGGTQFTQLAFTNDTLLTISVGAITVTQTRHIIDTEGSVSNDVLNTINGGVEGDIVMLQLFSGSHTVTFEHNTGNIFLATQTDFTLDNLRQVMFFMYDGARWCEVAMIRNASGGGSNTPVVNGRLTLTTGTPITTTDVTAATTVYFTPCNKGDEIKLYYASAWGIYTFSEISIAPSLSSNTNYDIFAYYNGSAVTLEAVAWTNATTRATGLTTQNGVLVKSGNATRLYLGTVRTTASSQFEDSYAKRFVYNYYNREPRPLFVKESANSWTVSSTSYAQVNGNTANQIEVVVGQTGHMIDLFASGHYLATGGSAIGFSIGLDGTTEVANLMGKNVTITYDALVHASGNSIVPLGYHYYTMLEKVTTASGTGYGDNNVPDRDQTGIKGVILL